MQADLSTSESRLQLAQDAGGVGLWDWDLTTGVGHWSSVVYRNLGLDPAMPPDTRAMVAIVHPDDRAAVRDMTRTARFERPHGRHRVPRDPPGRLDALDSLARRDAAQRGGSQLVRALGVNIDVTERRMAFERMRETEARFRALADSAPVLMWVIAHRRHARVRQPGLRRLPRRRLRDGARLRLAQAAPPRRPRPHRCRSRSPARRRAAPSPWRPATGARDGEYRWIRSVSQPRFGAERRVRRLHRRRLRHHRRQAGRGRPEADQRPAGRAGRRRRWPSATRPRPRCGTPRSWRRSAS